MHIFWEAARRLGLAESGRSNAMRKEPIQFLNYVQECRRLPFFNLHRQSRLKHPIYFLLRPFKSFKSNGRVQSLNEFSLSRTREQAIPRSFRGMPGLHCSVARRAVVFSVVVALHFSSFLGTTCVGDMRREHLWILFPEIDNLPALDERFVTAAVARQALNPSKTS
jgi:hypothetical protein